LFPEPSIIRALVLDGLARAGRSWRITCTSGSLNGLRAAAMAGLGITVQSATMILPGLTELPAGLGLPRLDETELIVLGTRNPSRPAATLFKMLVDNDHRLATA
jgi:DNA-binding transcriptional LysR family regulator